MGRQIALALAIAFIACGDRPAVPTAEKTASAAPTPGPSVDLAGYRTSFDLLANRVHAFSHHSGMLVVNAGDLEFLKLVDGGWKSSWILGEKDGDIPVAFVSGLSSTMFVPIDADGDGIGGTPLADVLMRLTMRSVVPKQRVSVFVNEKAVGTVEVPDAYAPVEVKVPAHALVLGENRIRLTFRSAGAIKGGKRSAAAIQRVEIGPPRPASTPSDRPLVVDAGIGGQTRRAFVVADTSRLSFYLQIPANAKLSLSYGAAEGGTAVVRVVRDGGPATILSTGATPTTWTDAAWDLGAYAGEAVRLDLISRGKSVAWAAPRIVVRAPEPPAAVARTFDRIYVWMVDTLRADKVRVYNPKTIVQTPNYDAFAADATRFAWAHVPGTWSLPSHASILTGVYPTVHKATAHEARLSREVPFVAELVKKAGYRTAIFSSNGYVSGKWGFDRGWDENRNFIRESLPNGAEYLWKTAKTWIEANKTKPQFIYLATVEPHVIYNPKKEFLARYWNKPYTGKIKPAMTGIQLGQIKQGKLKIDDNDKAYIEALHNAEITQSDAAFGAFIADLKAAGTYDTTAVIVISDHGDEFWDHGDVGHAQSVHQELVHVPLIIRAPGVFPTGKVVDADVEAMDLAPTMLELAGLTPPVESQGSSLLALAHDEVSSVPRVAMTQNTGISRGIKVGRYRLIHAGSSRLELYDEIRDPTEKTNLSGERPIALRQMRNVISILIPFENKWRKRVWGTAANVAEAFYAAAGGS